MATNQLKHILVAPLDWGLGHTARCVPLIRYLKSLGHHPIVACNNWQRSFLEATFGDIDIIHLDGYDISYSGWNRFLQMGLLRQMPKITQRIRDEQKWLAELLQEETIDGIISDNRYGLYHSSVPCVIMTHQLQVQSGLGDFVDRQVQKMHYEYLNRFDTTWVPDIDGVPNVGGKLSHTSVLPTQVKYVGLLSRFEAVGSGYVNGSAEKSDLLILLSGPEPQRSGLSDLLWEQVLGFNGKVIFVEGSGQVAPRGHVPGHVEYHRLLNDVALGAMLRRAAMVICRSGYSTVMDLMALGKKAIVIPTPGQTEQEYLGKHLHEQGIFYCAPQKGFDISDALGQSAGFPFHSFPAGERYSGYKQVIDEWLGTL